MVHDFQGHDLGFRRYVHGINGKKCYDGSFHFVKSTWHEFTGRHDLSSQGFYFTLFMRTGEHLVLTLLEFLDILLSFFQIA